MPRRRAASGGISHASAQAGLDFAGQLPICTASAASLLHGVRAAVQAAKTIPRDSAAAGSVASALAGQWSGEFRCGAYLGTASVPNPNPWNVAVAMTVRSDGNAVIARGDSTYSESIAGDIRPDLSATLKGRGAFKAKSGGSWGTEVVGRFVGAANADRFEGHGQIGSATGEVSRRCTVLLTKNAAT